MFCLCLHWPRLSSVTDPRLPSASGQDFFSRISTSGLFNSHFMSSSIHSYLLLGWPLKALGFAISDIKVANTRNTKLKLSLSPKEKFEYSWIKLLGLNYENVIQRVWVEDTEKQWYKQTDTAVHPSTQFPWAGIPTSGPPLAHPHSWCCLFVAPCFHFCFPVVVLIGRNESSSHLKL